MNRFFSSFLSPARRGMLFLSSGTTLAQLIMIGSVLVLVQFYSPEHFGIFALFGAVSAVGATIAGARYEMAVVIPETESEALNLVKLAVGISLGLAAVLLVLMPLGILVVGDVIGDGMTWLFCVLTPLNIWLMHAILTLNQWVNRCRRYPVLAKAAVLQALAINTVSLLLGGWALGAAGLMIGAIAGRVITLGFILRLGLAPGELGAILGAGISDLRPIARRFANHPRHLMPSTLVGTLSMQVPVLMLSNCFGAAVTGYYSMASRFITLPTIMISSAIGEVYRERISVRFREYGQFRSLFVRMLAALVTIAVVPFAAMYWLAPDLFATMLGPEWSDATDYAQIMIVAAFFQFVLTPLDKGAVIVGATRFVFFWQLSRLVLSLGIFATVYFAELSVFTTLWLIVGASTFAYLINCIANYHFSGGRPA